MPGPPSPLEHARPHAFPLPVSAYPSVAMQQVHRELNELRESDCNVLILGETGTGKSVLARSIHALGARARGAFVDVNCAGLSPDFVQSELFGHERGSFTGAYATTTGLLDAAHGGTLFLDEIGDMDVRVQPKLLKVLEEKRFRRIGDHRERHVDVRLVAATHCDLIDAVSRGTFRSDLYYRISTATLIMPPLRERAEDITLLAQDMLTRMDQGGRTFSNDAQEKLAEHDWPGNLRELKSVLERALLRQRSTEIRADDIRFAVGPSSPRLLVAPRAEPEAAAPRMAPEAEVSKPESTSLLLGGAVGATRGEVEREHIRLAVEAEAGCVKRAARRLGMARSTLYVKLRTYGIAVDTLRPAAAKLRVTPTADAPTSVPP